MERRLRGRGRHDGGNVRQMLRAIDEANRGYSLAREIYRQWLVDSGQEIRVPYRREFQRLDHRFSVLNVTEFNVGVDNHPRPGRPRVPWRTEERVIALARAFPLMGLRGIARRVGISHVTVRRIIREEGIRPGDYAARRTFCRWMLRKLPQNNRFLENVLFTDESTFSSATLQNRQNTRVWAYANPHATVQRFNQGRFSVNVWAGIVGNQIIGPVYLLRLNGATYLRFLRRDLLAQLRQVVPPNRRRSLYFMHDGAPAHLTLAVRDYLPRMFGARWIARDPAPHLWPPRSPDLNPLDFFMWGAVKDSVYRSGRQIETREQLKHRIEEAFRTIQNSPDTFEKVRRNMRSRLQQCLDNDGGHIEATGQARMLRAINNDGSVLWVRRRGRR